MVIKRFPMIKKNLTWTNFETFWRRFYYISLSTMPIYIYWAETFNTKGLRDMIYENELQKRKRNTSVNNEQKELHLQIKEKGNTLEDNRKKFADPEENK